MMKIHYQLLLIVSLLYSGCTFSRSEINYPSSIKPNQVFVLSFSGDLVTVVRNDNMELWQFNTVSNEIIFHFTFEEKFEKQLYSLHANDEGESYKRVKHIYDMNDVKVPLKIGRYYVNETNRIFTIIEAYDVKPVSKQNINRAYDPDKDFELDPFHVLVELGRDTIVKYLPIENIFMNTGYFLQGGIDFFQDEGDWILPVAQPQMNLSGKNYFLGRWQQKQGKLIFNSFLPLEIPNFNKQSLGGYGLSDFIYKNKKLMFYSNPYLYDIEKMQSRELKLVISDQGSYLGKQKGESFVIPISICDYYISENKVKVIIRHKSSFHIYQYNLKDYSLLDHKPITDYTTTDLYRFPFFSKEGRIVFTPKTTNDIVIINDK